LKILLIIFISITFIIFISSSVVLDTPWFSDYLSTYDNEQEIRDYLHISQFRTSLILASFLIGQATYFIKINGESKRKILELSFGLFIGITLIENLLTSYDRLVEFESILAHTPSKVKAENTLINAYDMYHMKGISIEYYDCNKTKLQYKPSLIDIQLRKQKNLWTEKLHKIPFIIVISFLVMIFSYFIGDFLADRRIKKRDNKTS